MSQYKVLSIQCYFLDLLNANLCRPPCTKSLIFFIYNKEHKNIHILYILEEKNLAVGKPRVLKKFMVIVVISELKKQISNVKLPILT